MSKRTGSFMLPHPQSFTAARILFLALLFLGLSLLIPSAYTQEAVEMSAETSELRTLLSNAAERLREGDMEEEELIEVRDRVNTLLPALQTRIATLEPRLALVEARLAELRPAEGETLPPALEGEFSGLEASLAETRAEINLNRSLIVEANQVLEAIALERQRIFQSRILDHRTSLISPRFYDDLPEAANETAALARERARDWIASLSAMSATWHAAVLGAILATALLGVWLWNRMTHARFLRINEEQRPATTVLLNFLVMSIVLFIAIVIINHLLRTNGYVPEGFSASMTVLSVALGLSVAFLSLSRAVLDPGSEKNYLVHLDRPARLRLHGIICLIVGLSFVHVVTLTALRVLDGEARLGTIEGVVISLAIGICLWRLRGPMRAVEGKRRLLPRILGAIASLAAVAAPLAAIIGYVPLANFILAQVLWVSFILVLAWLLTIWLAEQLGRNAEEETRVSRFLQRSTGMGAEGAKLACVLLQGLGRLVVILLAFSALALPWGGAGESLFARLASNIRQFELGGFSISPIDLIVAVVLFIVGLGVVRIVKLWFSQSFLPLTRFDEGIQNSLSTFAGYVGFIVVVLITLAYLGVALQNLAIIAGALSVGIGFGLQSIVNNFVSGLILLAERPFKVGDWVVVGTEQGNVRRINVRATEIETFDRASIIVPNADLITGVVKNWTHSNTTGRIIITIGVSYDADPEQVREILLRCAAEHETILTYPAPAVFFQDFGDNALIFELFAFLSAVDKGLSVKSDLRFAIHRELKKAGIGIPYPQRDVHLKGEVRLNAEGRPVSFNPAGGTEDASPPTGPQGTPQERTEEEPDGRG